MTDKEEKVKEETWVIGSVPKETKLVIINTEKNIPYSLEESIVLVLKEQDNIKELLEKILKKLS